MTTFDFNKLIEAATVEEVKEAYAQIFAVVGIDTTQWSPGGVTREYVDSTSILVSSLSDVVALTTRLGFLELSEGEWLTAVAHYVYGVDRIEPTFATGYETLVNSGGGLYNLGVGDLIIKNSITDKTYRNSVAIVLNPMSTLVGVAIIAQESGTDSTSQAGEIDTLVTVLTNVTVTNPLSVVGIAGEDDAELRSRCYAKLGSLSPMGPWDSYRWAVINAVRPDGTPLGITRTQVVKDGYGNVTLYVATSGGAVTSPDVAIADDAVQRKAAPLAVTATTESATTVPLSVTYEAWFYNTSAYSEAEALGVIEDALQAFVDALPIGGVVITPPSGYVFLSGIQGAIKSAFPEIFKVTLSVPNIDTELVAGQIAELAVVSGTVHAVPPTEGFNG